ncbi:cadherin-like beta sandwich domain-containing protein [uncultured Clostridium sp.]|uniref:cadherin-like beta sandwich domain-containing protein n=1 Tax=uncultured Clostridium sp. TaxID=59620 RepID=UPI0025F80753|nr:cadherin-like beta sandwich domain-containing protein [uncultured Clostridium sp.]
MSKKLKRAISLLMILNSFLSIELFESFNLVKPVYASSSFDSDYALLDSLKTDEGSLSFSSKRSTVTGKVKSNIDKVEITAKAKDSSYKITIDESESDTGSCNATLDLKKGSSNKFKIKVQDPNGEKSTSIYYVTITRGNSSSSSSSRSHSSSGDDLYLDNLTLSEGNINFSEDDFNYNVHLSEDVSSITIKAKPEDDDYTVTINGYVVDDDDNYKVNIKLEKGVNYIPIKLKDDDGDSSTYNLYVYRGDESDVQIGKIDNKQDDIYLDNLIIEDYSKGLQFKPKVTYYEVNLDNDWDSIILKAEPEDDDYTVRINDDKVKEESKYRKRVYLNEGRNEIKIRVDDKEDGDSYKDYDKRTYTLVVNRAYSNNSQLSDELTDENKEQQTNNSIDYSHNNNSDNNNETNEITADNSSNNTVKNNTKPNQWIKNEYGQWMYNDTIGNPIKSKWFLDTNTNKWYKFNSEGILCTGFQYENNKTYYLNEDGSMAVGWKQIGGNWYYFTSDGNMVSNKWFQDSSSGKWYYFYAGGVMATNVRIGGYTIGADGAMI